MKNLILSLICLLTSSQASASLQLNIPNEREVRTPTYVDRFVDSRRCELVIYGGGHLPEQTIALSPMMFSETGAAEFAESGLTGRSIRVQLIRLDDENIHISLSGQKAWHSASERSLITNKGEFSLSLPFGGSSTLEISSSGKLVLRCTR